METPYTDDRRIAELHEHVERYLDWINRVDADLRERHEKTQMRLKPINRHMVTTPVF